MTKFSVDVQRDGSTCTLVIAGEVDLQNSESLASIGRMALDAVNGHEVLIIDLTDVYFMDSTGLDALVVINNEARVNGHQLRLRGLQPLVSRVLELGGLASAFDLVDDM
jgi:anti-anti-sigma factor